MCYILQYSRRMSSANALLADTADPYYPPSPQIGFGTPPVLLCTVMCTAIGKNFVVLYVD